MTESTLPPGGIVWAKCTRITALDADGNIIPGNSVFVTDALMKATITPVNEAGDAVAIKNASGNLGVYALKGDIPKWYTVALEMVYPDAQLEALICGGTLFSDNTAALGAPSTPSGATATTGGTLAAGKYVYAAASYSVYGRTPISAEISETTTGSTSRNVITPVIDADSVGAVIYGRLAGQVQALGTVPNIGTQATSAASGTGVVTSLTVTALTQGVPAGMTFTIVGDTNTPKIVFTVEESGSEGETILAVTAPTITTTIAAGDLVPVFVDDGSAVPSGVPNTTDLSGGPGIGVGQQAPQPGFANAAAFSLEFFMERVEDGKQATDYPWFWFVLPFCTFFVVGARDVTNAELQALYTGTAFPNDNWGAGPEGDFPFDSSEILQWTVCGEDVVPEPSYVSQPAGV